jgi:hypothetical protein
MGSSGRSSLFEFYIRSFSGVVSYAAFSDPAFDTVSVREVSHPRLTGAFYHRLAQLQTRLSAAQERGDVLLSGVFIVRQRGSVVIDMGCE